MRLGSTTILQQRRDVVTAIVDGLGRNITTTPQHEGFRVEIERHGAWSAELQSAQVKLFDEEDAAEFA